MTDPRPQLSETLPVLVSDQTDSVWSETALAAPAWIAARLVLWLCLAITAAAPASAQTLFGFSTSPPRPETPKPVCAACRVLENQLKDSCIISGDVPFADVIYMRRPGVNGLPEALNAAVARALAGGDMATSRTLLSPFLGAAQEPDTRYAAGLFLTLAARQAGEDIGGPDVEAGLVAMTGAAAEGDAVLLSDLHFLRALRAARSGEDRAARGHVREAVLAEPQYFNALVLGIDLWTERALAVQSRSGALCNEAYGALISYTSAVAQISPCAYLSGHVDIHLSRRFAAPEAVAPISAVRTYLALISRRPDLAREAADRFSQTSAPLCRGSVSTSLEDLIETYFDTAEAAE